MYYIQKENNKKNNIVNFKNKKSYRNSPSHQHHQIIYQTTQFTFKYLGNSETLLIDRNIYTVYMF